MIINLGSHRLRRYDSRNWVLEELRAPKGGRAKSQEVKWRSCDRYFQSVGAAVLWVAEHRLLDEDTEVDLAGALREFRVIVDGIEDSFGAGTGVESKPKAKVEP